MMLSRNAPHARPLVLRGHHLLCVLGFQGHGYSESFVSNMSAIVARLNGHALVRVVQEPDDICRTCPHLGNTGCHKDTLEAEAEVKQHDKQVMSRLHLSSGDTLPWPDLLSRVRERISASDLPSICGDCEWLAAGYCKSGLEGLEPSLAEYLRPTRLCDFDRAEEIGSTARKLVHRLSDRRQMFSRIYRFVKELPYGLEDWDTTASQTLHKGWGMCSGKANLLVAMSRSVGIPARYRILRIKSEGTLWQWIQRQDSHLAQQMGDAPPQQDHVTAEVYLDGWEAFDPARDTPFEAGLKKLGIPLERKLSQSDDRPQVMTLASFDEWAQQRQQARRFTQDRQRLFSRINAQFDRIRTLGKD